MPALEQRTPVTEPIHIFLDERGVAWVDRTGVKVVEVVVDHTALGMSPEQIHEAHPDLSLAQIHAALAYYHDHKEALDADIAARDARVAELQSKMTSPLNRAELEERLRRRGKEPPL